MDKRKKFVFDQDGIFDICNIIIMIILLLIFTWPLWFVVIASVSDPTAVLNGEVVLLPKGFNLESYVEIFNYRDIWIGYRNTIFYTVVGTIINVILSIFAAYPLSRKDFVMKNFFITIFMITMYFSGGLIPIYLVVLQLGMVNTVWSLLLPTAISFYNVIIMKTYYQNSIPESLQEAAELDGANTWQYLWKIVLPLSKPVIAVIALYYAMSHWNGFFNALIYINDTELYPLQLFLRNILINNSFNESLMESLSPEEIIEMTRRAEMMKYGIIIISTVPALCAYPFVQKFFVKGVMIGAVKG